MGVTDLSAGELAHRLRYGRSVPGIPVVEARLQGQACIGVGRTSRRYWSCAYGVSSALAADLAGVDGSSARRAHTPPTGILTETSGCCLLESPPPVGAASSIKQTSVFSHSLFLAAALSQTPPAISRVTAGSMEKMSAYPPLTLSAWIRYTTCREESMLLLSIQTR